MDFVTVFLSSSKKKGLHCFRVVGQAHCVSSFLLHPGETRLHLVQGMEHSSGNGWEWSGHLRLSIHHQQQGSAARVSKLEVAMAVVGEFDPTFSASQEVLKKAQGQAQVRQSKTGSLQRRFSLSVRRHVNVCHEEVSRAQEVIAQAQTKLQSEEQGLIDEAFFGGFAQEFVI